MSPTERVSKILAAAGVASRRGADALIAAGRVTVDGRTIGLGETADAESARIAVDGRLISSAATAAIHLALNKPIGVTSTVRDRHATRTVVDLVSRDLVPTGSRLYPVGRLDLESEGLLFLTNDGTWAEQVLHPRFEVEREYAAAFAHALEPHQLRDLQMGVDLEEGRATIDALRAQTQTETRQLEELLLPVPDRGLHWYRVTIRQGWKRQLRRVFGAVGAPVLRLVRVRIGAIRLGDLPTGEVRLLSPTEVRRLRSRVSS